MVGVAGDITKKEKDAFKFLLHLDIFRGKHSTGVASVKTNGDWDLVKKAGTAWDLFEVKAFNTLMTGTSYALIGHNRAATKGKVNNINAHPFEMEDVVGAHNGTLRGQHRLPDHTRFEVDSENIFHAIQVEGLEETLSKLDGAYALTYWDKRSEELVLLRNNERSLFYAMSEDGLTVFWASEAWMLSVALSRYGLKHRGIFDVVECHIHRFTFDRAFKPKWEMGINIQKFEEFVPPKPATSYSYGGNTHVGKPPGGNVGTNEKENKSLPSPINTGSKQLKVDPLNLVNTEVDFVIDGVQASALGQQYIEGSPLCDESLELRIFFSPHLKDDLDEVMRRAQDTIFSVDVVSYRDGVLYGKPGSVREVQELIDDSDDEYPGYDGERLTEDEWIKRTKKGCCACGDPSDLSQADVLVWIDTHQFICAPCADMDWVKEHLLEA